MPCGQSLLPSIPFDVPRQNDFTTSKLRYSLPAHAPLLKRPFVTSMLRNPYRWAGR